MSLFLSTQLYIVAGVCCTLLFLLIHSFFYFSAITKQCCPLWSNFLMQTFSRIWELNICMVEKLYTRTVLRWWRNSHWTLYAHSSKCMKLKYILGFSGIAGHIISVNTKWCQGWELAPRRWKRGTNHAKHLKYNKIAPRRSTQRRNIHFNAPCWPTSNGSPMRKTKKHNTQLEGKDQVSQTFGQTPPWNIRLEAYHSKTTEAWGYLQYKRKGWGLKDGASRTCRKLATVERLHGILLHIALKNFPFLPPTSPFHWFPKYSSLFQMGFNAPLMPAHTPYSHSNACLPMVVEKLEQFMPNSDWLVLPLETQSQPASYGRC